jgi:hypothetical protein
MGFDDDGHLWNLPRTGAFVFHNASCSCTLHALFEISVGFLYPSICDVILTNATENSNVTEYIAHKQIIKDKVLLHNVYVFDMIK